MICGSVKHLLCQNLNGQRIISINFNKLPDVFQNINEYDSIDIFFNNGSILRVQCTLRILYNNQIVFLSNDRFLTDPTDSCEKNYDKFSAQLKKLSLLIMNSQIVNTAFTALGDLKFVTNTEYEFQVLIDTRRTDCVSYELFNFNSKTNLLVSCNDGIIVGTQEGGAIQCN